MNGEMLLYGYKFARKISINFNYRTVLVPKGEYKIGHDIFQFLYTFFGSRDFSNIYFDKGLGIMLNGMAMHGSEYEVFYLPPLVDVQESVKLLKKSLLGRLFQQIFSNEAAEMAIMQQTVQEILAGRMNKVLEKYHMQCNCDTVNILDYGKLLSISGAGSEGDLQLNDVSQYDVKRMVADIVGSLPVAKPRLLLAELPEYALASEQVEAFMQMLVDSPIEYIIFLTQDESILQFYNNIYYYHCIMPNGICSFEDWEEMAEDGIDCDMEHIKQRIMKQFFSDIYDAGLKKYFKDNTR